MKKEKKHNIVIKNKKASRDYTFIDTYIAGIQLTGTEIKSIRSGKASLVDSYCRFRNGELFVTGMNIAEYYWGNINNHEPRRERKLLLHKKELRKLERKIKESGLTIIMTKLFINDRGIANTASLADKPGTNTIAETAMTPIQTAKRIRRMPENTTLFLAVDSSLADNTFE